jgi:hypothetical protein
MMACLPILTVQNTFAASKAKREEFGKNFRSPSTMAGKTVLIPIGTTFEGRVDTTLSSTKSKAGQAFGIIMSAPVLANGVDVIIPAGSKVMGEVVEAVPSGNVPYKKKIQPKPRGKLRIQLTGLQTPDGVTYPMVASVAGEVDSRGRSRRTPLGTGVAYMGSSSQFEAVAPGAPGTSRNQRAGQAAKVMKRKDMLKDTLYGLDNERKYHEEAMIRSLVLKKRDYFIFEGSPMTVRLDAPFKMGITPHNAGIPVTAVEDEEVEEELPSSTKRPAGATANSTNAQGNPKAPPSQPDESF